VIAFVVGDWITDAKEKTKRRHQVFQSLWLTRNDMNMMGGRMSPEHVRALNMIEIEFTATGLDRFLGRVEECDAVIEAWHIYRNAFFVPDFADPSSPEAQEFFAARDLLLVNLLAQMSRLLGFNFTPEKILDSSYAPKGHSQVEAQIGDLRMALLELAQGKRPLQISERRRSPYPPRRRPLLNPTSRGALTMGEPDDESGR
jgi:hypothetical protein